MKVSIYVQENEGGLVKLIVSELERRHDIVSQDKCICQLENHPTPEDLGDLVIIHPDDRNSSGCYDAISEFVEQYPQVQFYILALQDSARKEPREAGIGIHKNVIYVNDESRKELIYKLMRM